MLCYFVSGFYLYIIFMGIFYVRFKFFFFFLIKGTVVGERGPIASWTMRENHRPSPLSVQDDCVLGLRYKLGKEGS